MGRKQFAFWTTSQILSANGFNWVENLSKFNEDFIRIYYEKSNERYFLKVHKDLSFWPKIKKVNKVKNLVANFHDKKKTYYTHRKYKTSIKLRISFERNSQFLLKKLVSPKNRLFIIKLFYFFDLSYTIHLI